MNAIDNVIAARRLDSQSTEEIKEADAARAELAALRATVATLTAQNAEQAQQLEQARKAMADIKEKYDIWCNAPEPNTKAFFFKAITIAREWLAANAPAEPDAPEREQTR
jgi:ribosomal protein L29